MRQEEIKNQLLDLKAQLKASKKAKAEIAVQFKKATTGTDAYLQLIAQMQKISTQLKTIEKQIKDVEKQTSLNSATQHDPDSATPPLLTIAENSNWNGEIDIREIHLDEWKNWYDYVASINNATAYHQAAWKEVIDLSFSNPTRVWAAFNNQGDIIGGIPLTFFNSSLFGKFAVSIPYLNYGGVISLYFNVAQKILAMLPSVCEANKLAYIEIRTMQSSLGDMVSSKKASMILALPNTSEELDKNLGSKIRAQYKKAEEHHPDIQFGKLELIDDFYNVFAKNMRDLGTPVYSKNWFANILKHPSIDSTLAVVYVNQKPVSAGFLVGHNRMLEIPWASTIKEANALNTNMWMYRKILDFAIQHNFHFFDFGRSTQDAGTYKFKKQWGTTPYLHYWYKVTPGKNTPVSELNPDNPKFALMIALWKKLPIWISKIIGPIIIRNIP